MFLQLKPLLINKHIEFKNVKHKIDGESTYSFDGKVKKIYLEDIKRKTFKIVINLYNNFDNNDNSALAFDFKGFLFKVLGLWKLVVLSIGAALCVAYLINVRKQNIYRLDSLISIENDQNPFFTANTSISFNWGGVSGKVGKVITSLNTRSHNEKVVDSLQFYIEYLVQKHLVIVRQLLGITIKTTAKKAIPKRKLIFPLMTMLMKLMKTSTIAMKWNLKHSTILKD